MPMSELTVGSVIDGFVLGERLTSGGMGSIWHASRPDLGFPLILKIPFLNPGEDVSTIVGYEVEAMIMKRLTGPHVPLFVATGDLRQTPYIAMEFIAGETLKSQLTQAPLPAAKVSAIGQGLAIAVDDIHRQGVAHLDLKPGNIIMSDRGGVVLIDFGLARHDELPDLLGEESGLPIGTPAYIAPEQVLGDRTNPASDIFAIGAILYELATGEKPFGDPATRAGMERRLYHTAAPPRAIVASCPRWLQEIILKCLETDPARRYASASQLTFDLANPAQVVLSDRGRLDRGEGFLSRARRSIFGGKRRLPAPTGSIAGRSSAASIVMTAVDLTNGADALAEELRTNTACVLASEAGARLACVTVLKTKLAGEDELVDAAGRPTYVARLVQLKDWARAFGLPEERVSYHVLEALDPAAAILVYARHNHVDHIVLGARGSSALRRHLGSVSAQVVAEATCSVTVVRLRRSHLETNGDEPAPTLAPMPTTNP